MALFNQFSVDSLADNGINDIVNPLDVKVDSSGESVFLPNHPHSLDGYLLFLDVLED